MVDEYAPPMSDDQTELAPEADMDEAHVGSREPAEDTDVDADRSVLTDLKSQLMSAFVWQQTPQGHEYWVGVYNNLELLDRLANKQEEGL